jgi:hypothetical protein
MEKENVQIIKLIAILTMLVDHVGFIFFPNILIFRLIGRLAFPLYAFLISEGMKHTSSRKKYFMRLFFIALISQLVYVFAIDWKMNVIFGLLLGALSIYFIEKKKYFILPIIFLLPIFIPTDYTVFSVIIPIIFYFFDKKWVQAGLLYAIFSIMILYYGHYMSIFHIFSLLFIYYIPFFTKKLDLKKSFLMSPYFNYFYRFFYPAHLFLLFLLKKIIF